MPDQLNPEERRAFREGEFSARLDGHDRHFGDINGSISKLATAVIEVEKTLARVGDQVQGVVLTMPSLQKLASETASSTETAQRVAEALRVKTEQEQTTWDRYRGIVAWSLGVVIATVTIANFTSRMLGVAVKTPPAATVTVDDITPGYP